MTPSDPDLARIAKLQARHQNILIVLSVVVAVSAMVTWKSVTTLRELNEQQKQSVAAHKPDAPAKTALTRHSTVRQPSEARSEPRQPAKSTWNRQPRSEEQSATVDSLPARSTQVAGANTVAVRVGRQ
jgi:dihydrodipicolinate reductase